jgi:hypothetical protein
MASLFGGGKPEKVMPIKSSDPEAAKAAINKQRQRASGKSFASTIVGSAGDLLKTSTGA